MKDLAFPLVSSDVESVHDTGMTLRDYFAGQYLCGPWASDLSGKSIAKRCYEVADAMMEARKE